MTKTEPVGRSKLIVTLPEPHKRSEEKQMQTFGFCVYHKIECDYEGLCIKCPHNTKEDIAWFKEDGEKEQQ